MSVVSGSAPSNVQFDTAQASQGQTTYAASPLCDPRVFDAAYYLSRYPDLVAAGITTPEQAAQHWLDHGISEGRQASPGFDVAYYLASNPDVAAAYDGDHRAGLQHYLSFGFAEGRRTTAASQPATPAIDSLVTTSQPPGGTGVGQATSGLPSNGEPVAQASAAAIGRQQLTDSRVFDASFYLSRYPDLLAAGIDTQAEAEEHWLNHGISEGRVGCPSFSVDVYLANNQDVAAAVSGNKTAALMHYLSFGSREGRVAAPADAAGWASAADPTSFGAVTDPAGSATIGNSVMSIGTSASHGGAITSLVHDGKELVNNTDHGRQIQYAWQVGTHGESWNPTEAGNCADGDGSTSSAQLLHIDAGPGVLHTTSHPAHWINGDQVSGFSGAAVTDDVRTSAVLQKSVTVGYNGDPHVVHMVATVSNLHAGPGINFEAPTGYLAHDMNVHLMYDPQTGTFVDAGSKPTSAIEFVGTTNPIMMVSEDGQHAVGVFVPPQPTFQSYALLNYVDPNGDTSASTNKWSCVFTCPNTEWPTPQAPVTAEAFMIVGTPEEVEASMRALMSQYA